MLSHTFFNTDLKLFQRFFVYLICEMCQQVLDSGIMTSLDDFTRVCNPKLLIIDLATDNIVRQVIFPREVLRPASLLTNIILDESVQGTCDSLVAYMTDTAAPGNDLTYIFSKIFKKKICRNRGLRQPKRSSLEIDASNHVSGSRFLGLYGR